MVSDLFLVILASRFASIPESTRFYDTCTVSYSVTIKPRLARTVKRTHSVYAFPIALETIVLVGVTFIDIYTEEETIGVTYASEA